MRAVLFGAMVMVGCGASHPVATPAPASPHTPALADAPASPRGAPAPACPVEVLRAAPPAVAVFPSLAAAKAALIRGATPSPDEDLIAEAAAHGPAFGTSVLVRAYAGSMRVFRNHGVFVQGKRVIVVERLGDVSSVIPGGRCSLTAHDEVIAARILPAGATSQHPHLGQVRYRRVGVSDAPTLPDQIVHATTEGEGDETVRCPARTSTFRIEDHFVDLDTGEYVFGLAQVYRGNPWPYGGPTPELPIERFVAGETGITVPGCAELRWPFPPGE